MELPKNQVQEDTCKDKRNEESEPFDEYRAKEVDDFHRKGLVRDFALVEAVRIAIEGIDAFSSGIDARYRINRAQHIQVMRNGRLLQLEFCGELGNSHSLLSFPEKTDKLVATATSHHLETVGAKLLLG